MAVSKAHLLQYPKNFIICRVLQLVLSVIVLGLTIWACIYVPFNGVILGIFTSICTIIILTYILLATYPFPVAYNYWAILVLDIFLFIFWLVSMALLAVVAAYVWENVDSVYCSYYSGYCTKKYNNAAHIYGSVEVAATGLAAAEFILFIVSMILTSVTIHRHRKAGGHARPLKVIGGGAGAGLEAGYGNGNGLGGPTAYNPVQGMQPEKYEMNPNYGNGYGNAQTYTSPPVEHQGPAPLQHNGPYQAVPQGATSYEYGVQGAQQYQPGVGPR